MPRPRRSAPLGRGLRADGLPVVLFPAVDPGARDTNNFGWPWELWPWPPGWACANTGRPPALYMRGTVAAGCLPVLAPAAFLAGGAPPQLRLALYGDEVRVDVYQVQIEVTDALVVGLDGGLQLVTAAEQLANASAAVGDDPVAASRLAVLAAALEAGGGGNEGSGGSTSAGGTAGVAAEVTVAALSRVTLRAGFAAVLDACSAWMIDQVSACMGLHVCASSSRPVNLGHC